MLASVLGGISQEQFLTMFGLDHESLRRGGDALLLGQGNVGESLFGAAMAGAEVHHVLRSLVTEAEGLFTAKAHTKPLNEAIKAWSAAHKRTREAETSHESIDAQTRGLDELRRDRGECEIALKRLNVERAKLERIARALPLLTKRRALAQRRRDLGIIAPLPASAGQARLDDLRTVSEALLEIRAPREAARRAHAPQPRDRGPRVAGTSPRVPARPDRPSRHLQKEIDELPRLQGEMNELEAEMRALLRKIGRDLPLDQVENLRIDAGAQATLRKLALEMTAISEAKLRAFRALAEREARRQMLVEERERFGGAARPRSAQASGAARPA